MHSEDTNRRKLDWNWLDKITAVDEAEKVIAAHRCVDGREWYFPYHFECFPVVPGVFLVEMMSQAAGYLQTLRARSALSEWAHYFLAGTDNTRFYQQVPPGKRVDLTASVSQGDEEQVVIKATATVDGRRVARSDVMLHRVHAPWLLDQEPILMVALRRLLTEPLQQRYGVPAGSLEPLNLR